MESTLRERVVESPLPERAVESPTAERAVESSLTKRAVESPLTERAMESPLRERAVELPLRERTVMRRLIQRSTLSTLNSLLKRVAFNVQPQSLFKWKNTAQERRPHSIHATILISFLTNLYMQVLNSIRHADLTGIL